VSERLVTIVIPTLNEAKGIKRALEQLPRRELGALGFGVQALVVDGCSNDGTAEIARSLGADVVSEPPRGYGRALKLGFANARGDIIVTADGDGSYPIESIPAHVRLLVDNDLDLVVGNRFAYLHPDAMPFHNKVGNRLLSLAARLLFGVRLTDVESGMWTVRKSLIDKLVLGSDGWPFSHEFKIEAIRYARCRWKEEPIEYRLREGDSKLPSWKTGFEDLVHLLRKRVNRYAR
jgi:glycosyltransferase involved in cell wall biosynthesis